MILNKTKWLWLFILLLQVLIPELITSQPITQKITKLAKAYNVNNAQIGIALQRTKNHNWLYRYHAHEKFKPASVNKLFTAITALTHLPPSFHFKTAVYANQKHITKHQLKGNLYIQFTGDPGLIGSQLKKLIHNINDKGINKIKGDIILVADAFTGNYYPEGWAENDIQHCYAAPASSMNLNHNCLILSVISTGGEQSKIKKLINGKHIDIHNNLKLKFPVNEHSCQFDATMNNRNELFLDGCLRKQASTRLKFAIVNPALKTLETVKTYINESPLHHTGKIRIGHKPQQSLNLITQITSGNRNSLIEHMLVHSDNLYAESMARATSQYVQNQGTIQAATQLIESTLEQTYQIDTQHMVIKDGSGLSQLDRVTPTILTQLLTRAYHQPDVGKTLYQALPTAGYNGTMTYRLGNSNLIGQVHAKTGTLNDAIALAGYMITQKNHRLTFSLLLNKLHHSQRKQARQFQDALLKYFFTRF